MCNDNSDYLFFRVIYHFFALVFPRVQIICAGFFPPFLQMYLCISSNFFILSCHNNNWSTHVIPFFFIYLALIIRILRSLKSWPPPPMLLPSICIFILYIYVYAFVYAYSVHRLTSNTRTLS